MTLPGGFFSIMVSTRGEALSYLAQHIYLTLVTVAAACVIAIPAGVLISRTRGLSVTLITVASLLYTIPSLALFGLLVPVMGIGNRTALTALIVYALFPLIRNTYVGITGIEPSIIEAAQGMGVNQRQLLWRVQLPLASPLIISGIRQVVVMTIGIAAIAAFVGAGGLGIMVFEAQEMMNVPLIVYSTLLLAGLAFVADRLIGMVERRVRKMLFSG